MDDGLYRPQDEANAIGAFKAGQDSLVDANIVPRDSRKYVRQGPVTIYGTQKEHRGKCGVVLTITPIGDVAGDPWPRGEVSDEQLRSFESKSPCKSSAGH
ncbi:MAG TPA: hypothetical protein VHK86_00060 [Nitrososphaera sp.]|nr:hypothetical protein [Nitrososphaera sp.]